MRFNEKFHNIENLEDKLILITGGAGFIGSHLVGYLIQNGARVRVLDNLSTGFIENLKAFENHKSFELITGDICSLDDCLLACEGVDAISHQAALGSVPRSIDRPDLTTLNNITGFVNMVQAAKVKGVGRIVYASSSSVYGDDTSLPKVEHKIGNPMSPYAVSKWTNEVMAQNFSRIYPIDFVGLRYFNVFGPHQSPQGAYAAVIPLFIKACLEGSELFINGDGSQTRDFTFVENVVQCNIKALFTESKQALNQVYNVGCGGRFSVNDLFKIIKRETASKVEPVYREKRSGDVMDSQADFSKAVQLLGYNPKIHFEEGIQITISETKKEA